MSKRKPIWNVNAEMAVLGAMILYPAWVAFILKRLKADYFWKPAHKMLFSACASIHESGSEINTLSLETVLKQIGKLEESGGLHYPLDLAAFVSETVGEGVIVSGCDAILDCWGRRRIQEIADQADEFSSDALLEQCLAVKEGSSPVIRARSGGIAEFRSQAGLRKGCPTGINFIDSTTSGIGWPSAQMSVVAAYTGTGKSAVMIQSALAIVRRGGRVLYGTWADLSGGEIYDRLTLNICGWSYRPNRDDLAAEYDAAIAEIESFADRLMVYDASALRKGKELEAFSPWLARRHDKTPYDAVFLDYGQKLKIENCHKMSPNERAENTSEQVRWMSKEFDCPFVVGSQITEGSTKFDTRDITKGSRAWEEDCGLLIRVKTFTDDQKSKIPDYNSVDGLSRIEIGKSRVSCKDLSTFIQFHKRHVMFVDL